MSRRLKYRPRTKVTTKGRMRVSKMTAAEMVPPLPPEVIRERVLYRKGI